LNYPHREYGKHAGQHTEEELPSNTARQRAALTTTDAPTLFIVTALK
jgi:hypothetical protein